MCKKIKSFINEFHLTKLIIDLTKTIENSQNRQYILVGDKETWDVAIKNSQWGFTQKNRGLWNTTSVNDLVLFYVTKPIKKIIGYGIIKEKFESEDFLWPDEKTFERSLWKYRLRFEINQIVEDWDDGIEPPSNMMLNIGRKVIGKDTCDELLKKIGKKFS